MEIVGGGFMRVVVQPAYLGVLGVLVSWWWNPAAAAEPVRYRVAVDDPAAHLLRVELTVPDAAPPHLDVAMPAWAPGNYRIYDFAKNVLDLEALDADGKPLPRAKTDKQTWRINVAAPGAVTVRYRIYANALNVTESHVDDAHACLNGAGVFLYVVGGVGRPVSLAVDAPRGWRTSTALPPGPEPGTFAAEDYDALVDAPIELGTAEESAFAAAGARFRVLMHGSGNEDRERLRKELPKLVEAEAAVFGGPPFPEYLFLYHLLPTLGSSGSGLEHRASASITWGTWGFAEPKDYEDFYWLTAHEFFHLWNVKRIRPEPLGPFDYAREVHTRYLWLSEGCTSYYADLSLARSGLVPRERFYKRLTKEIEEHETAPGRTRMSPEEASWESWTRPGRPPGTGIDYYNAGELVGWLLDIEIRGRSGGRGSLDEVLRRLFREYAQAGKGFPDGAPERIAAEVAGEDLGDFFHRHVAGTEPLPYETALARAGLVLERKKSPAEPWLGVTTGSDPAGASVRSVLPDSPAAAAGLAADDLIVAVDGLRLQGDLSVRLKAKGAGAHVRLTLFRGDRLIEKTSTLGSHTPESFTVKEAEKATEEQKALREAWLTGKQTGN